MRKTIIAAMIGATLSAVHCAAIPVDRRIRAYFGARGGGRRMNYQSFYAAAHEVSRNENRLDFFREEAAEFTEDQWAILDGGGRP